MTPTPPPAPTNGVAILMAEIERIAQELRAVNKRPLPATEDQVQALVKLAERDRPLTLNMNSEAVAKQLVGQVEQQAKVFQATGYELVSYLDNRQRAMTAALDKGVAAVQAAEAQLQASVQQIPRSVPLNVLENWRATLGFTLGPVVLVLLTLLLSGHFSRVPKAEYDRLLGTARAVSAERDFYQGQIQEFRKQMGTTKEMRKTTQQLFPPYVPPANAEKR